MLERNAVGRSFSSWFHLSRSMIFLQFCNHALHFYIVRGCEAVSDWKHGDSFQTPEALAWGGKLGIAVVALVVADFAFLQGLGLRRLQHPS